MPVDKREEALAAVEVLLKTVPGVAHHRTPNFTLGVDDLPAVILFDGEEEVEPIEANVLNVRTRCSVLCAVRTPGQVGLGTALNELRAKVRTALGSDPTLGGRITLVAYQGCEEPVFVTEEGAPPHALVALNYELWRQEAELDPYQSQ